MTPDLVRVWEPLQLKNIELRNRIVRSAHTTGLGVDGIGDALIRYHLERARGGVALSVIEAAGIHASCPYGIPIQDDAVIPGLRRLVETARPAGMHLIQQLFHIGPHGPTPDGRPSWAASYIPGSAPGLLSHPVTVDEIQEVVAGFAAAARRCREAGVAGVEVHGAHGYLLHTFLSRATNLRTDQYGGSFENRLRIMREVLDAVRAEVGDDYLVGVRLSTEDGVQDGTGASECALIARALQDTGQIDYISLSCGNSGYQPARIFAPLPFPHAYEIPYSREVTQAVSLPTMVSGRFLSLQDAEAALEAGDADLVSIVRGLLADPYMVAKTRQGRLAEVRPCIGCNQACVGGIVGGIASGVQVLECTVNPDAGHELTGGDDVPFAATPLSVLVVGGGPAGLEAARVAALAGHSVALHERAPVLGGQLRLAGANASRAETISVLDWWEHELRRLGVSITLDSVVERWTVEHSDADAVIVATGSYPRRDAFQSLMPAFRAEGLAPERILTSWDVLTGTAKVGRSAMVYDDYGHFEAIDVAAFLLAQGVAVTFVTRNATVGERLDGGPVAWEAIGQPHFAHLLGYADFSLHIRSFVSSVEGDAVTIRSRDAPARAHVVNATSIVMLSGNLPERALLESLKPVDVTVRVVGDAIDGPRMLRHAVVTGNQSARSLGMAVRSAGPVGVS